MQNRILGINHIRTKYIPNIFHDSKTTYLMIRLSLTLCNFNLCVSNEYMCRRPEPYLNAANGDESNMNLTNKGFKWKNKEKENSIFI